MFGKLWSLLTHIPFLGSSVRNFCRRLRRPRPLETFFAITTIDGRKHCRTVVFLLHYTRILSMSNAYYQPAIQRDLVYFECVWPAPDKPKVT